MENLHSKFKEKNDSSKDKVDKKKVKEKKTSSKDAKKESTVPKKSKGKSDTNKSSSNKPRKRPDASPPVNIDKAHKAKAKAHNDVRQETQPPPLEPAPEVQNGGGAADEYEVCISSLDRPKKVCIHFS